MTTFAVVAGVAGADLSAIVVALQGGGVVLGTSVAALAFVIGFSFRMVFKLPLA